MTADTLPDSVSLSLCTESLRQALEALPEGQTTNRIYTLAVLAAKLEQATPAELAAVLGHAIRDIHSESMGESKGEIAPVVAIGMDRPDLEIATQAVTLFAELSRMTVDDPAYVRACHALAVRLRDTASAMKPDREPDTIPARITAH